MTAADESGAGAEPADAAIVVVNYRTPALVEQCLESVLASRGDLRLEVAVIDNGSGDESIARLGKSVPDARIVAMDRNRGFAAGVNAGFRHTDAEVVIVLNPDTELQGDALRQLVQGLRERARTGVLAPLLEGPDGGLVASGYRRLPNLMTLALDLCMPLNYAIEWLGMPHPYAIAPAKLLAGQRPVHVCGAAMAIRRSAYADAGPLDEGFFLYLEETEWQSRVAGCSWEIEVATGARARHLVRGGGEESLSPSPHFVTSALRYLSLEGVPLMLARATFALALGSSWLTALLICGVPSKRGKARIQARSYRTLLGVALGRTTAPV